MSCAGRAPRVRYTPRSHLSRDNKPNARLRVRVPGLQVLHRGHAEGHRYPAQPVSFVRQEQLEEAGVGAGVPPEGERLVRDRFQVRQGEQAQHRRRREGRGRRDQSGGRGGRGGQARGGCQGGEADGGQEHGAESRRAKSRSAESRRPGRDRLIAQEGERARQRRAGRNTAQLPTRLSNEARTRSAPLAMNSGARKRNLRRYLVAGVLVWLPILATLWVVVTLLHFMDLALLLVPPAYRPEKLVGFSLPGAGAVLALVVVLLTGLLVTNLIGRRLIVWGEELLNRIPVVRTVYGSVKSLAESVLSQSNSFRKVVMVEYPRAGAWSIGFLTAEDVPEVSEKMREPHVAVYISAALNATAGYPVVVARRQVVELEMSVDEAMKMIITCGVVVPPAPHAHATKAPVAKPAA